MLICNCHGSITAQLTFGEHVGREFGSLDDAILMEAIKDGWMDGWMDGDDCSEQNCFLSCGPLMKSKEIDG